MEDGLYVLRSSIQPSTTIPILNSITNEAINIWHLWLGHLSHEKLVTLHRQFSCVSVPKYTTNCDVCSLAKQKRLPFPTNQIKSVTAFDLLHIDIRGPNSLTCIHGYRYYLTIFDDFTRHTWLFFLKAKSETSTCIVSFINMVETQFSSKVKYIRSNNEPEFKLI